MAESRLHVAGRPVDREYVALYHEEKAKWFESHKNANWITFDTRTGEPVEAVYDRIAGVPRTYVARYPWPPAWFEELLCV